MNAAEIFSLFRPVECRGPEIPAGAKTAVHRDYDPEGEVTGKARRELWGEGPWQREPDRVEWRAHGLPCLIVRNRMGALCGYVGLPPGHPYHGHPYNSAEFDPEAVSVHGGLSFANECGGHICHVPEAGEPAAVWWLGFDCGHWRDWIPGLERCGGSALPGESYRSIGYVAAQVERLAEGLASKGSGEP